MRFLIFLALLSFVKTGEAKTVGDSTHCFFICCRPDGLAPSGIMLDHVHDKGRFALAYSFMGMDMKGNQQADKKISDATVFTNYMMSTESMNMQMHMLMPMYGISSRLTVMGMLTYNIYTMQMKMMPAPMMNMPGMVMEDNGTMPSTMRSYGPGDTKIHLLYNLLPECDQRLVASFGMSLPTGDVDVRGLTMQSDYGIFPYGMQLGTGTFDYLPALVYVVQREKFSGGVASSAILRAGLNRKNYRWGNEYSMSPWLAYKFKDWASFSLRGEYYRMEKLKGYDAEINLSSGNDASANVGSYGLQKVNLHLGLNLYLPSGILKESRLLLEYGFPVYQNVNGIQSRLRSTFTTRIQYDF